MQEWSLIVPILVPVDPSGHMQIWCFAVLLLARPPQLALPPSCCAVCCAGRCMSSGCTLTSSTLSSAAWATAAAAGCASSHTRARSCASPTPAAGLSPHPPRGPCQHLPRWPQLQHPLPLHLRLLVLGVLVLSLACRTAGLLCSRHLPCWPHPQQPSLMPSTAAGALQAATLPLLALCLSCSPPQGCSAVPTAASARPLPCSRATQCCCPPSALSTTTPTAAAVLT